MLWNSLKSLTVVLVLCFALVPPTQAETRERANVILIKVDDLDFNELGYAGSDRHLTPAIDALAANGLRFGRGYVTSTVCTPSRYSTLTGRFASRSRALQAEPTSSWRRGNYPLGGPANVHFNTRCIRTIARPPTRFRKPATPQAWWESGISTTTPEA